MGKTRLDQIVFDQGHAPSRERAKALILAGDVYVNGEKVTRPGVTVDDAAAVEVRAPKCPM